MTHLIEWESIELRVDGRKIEEVARAVTAGEPLLERLQLRFGAGVLRIDGVIRKIFAIPFTVEIRQILSSGLTVRVPLDRISAGSVPIPTVLAGLLRNRLPPELVRLEDPATLVIALDRFLPSFVTAEVQNIWIMEGGLRVLLGRGGADLPDGGIDGSALRV